MKKNHKRSAGASKLASTSTAQRVQLQAEQPSVIYYRTCEKLPLSIYEDCLLDGDLTGLGTGPDVANTWDKLYTEALEISQHNSYNEVFELMKEINDLRGKMAIVNSAIKHLQMTYDRDVVVLLNSFALQCKLEPQDTGLVLVKKLNAVVANMKRWFPALAQKEKDLERLRAANTGKMDRAYFDDWLDAVGATRGAHIQAQDITVARFYRAVTKLKNEEAAHEAASQSKR